MVHMFLVFMLKELQCILNYITQVQVNVQQVLCFLFLCLILPITRFISLVVMNIVVAVELLEHVPLGLCLARAVVTEAATEESPAAESVEPVASSRVAWASTNASVTSSTAAVRVSSTAVREVISSSVKVREEEATMSALTVTIMGLEGKSIAMVTIVVTRVVKAAASMAALLWDRAAALAFRASTETEQAAMEVTASSSNFLQVEKASLQAFRPWATAATSGILQSLTASLAAAS